MVEFVGDALAVRRGPGSAYEEVGAARIALGAMEFVGAPYRLTTGERLVIQDGPLRIEGTDWYSVRPADLGDLGTTVFAEGWVPAGEAGAAYLEAAAVPDGSCCFSALGAGSGTTMTVPPAAACSSPSGCGRAIRWAAGLADPAGSCELRITQDRTGAVIVEQLIQGWARGAEWWPEAEGAALVVESDCSWSLHIGPA